MTRFRRSGLLEDERSSEDGVYAILYAVLVVVLLGMGAIVVDFAQVRQDRRLDRSATDAAVVGGVRALSPGNPTGASPYQACLSAWRYLSTTLAISTPGSACGNFASYDSGASVSSYCSATSAPWPAEIVDDRPVSGGRTVRIAWPIPYHSPGGPVSEFLTPEVAPGSVSQNFNDSVDGSVNGCDRLGVAVFEDEKFGLGSGIGARGTKTQVHSVARYKESPGSGQTIAALNILDLHACRALYASGQGAIRVFPDTTGGGGVIAVESDGTTDCSGGTKYVIDSSLNASALICALGPGENASNCATTLGGSIQSHALETPQFGKAYSPGKIHPVPIPEGGIYGWTPVTDDYGCATLTSSPPRPVRSCPNPRVPTPNYIKQLDSAYATGTPTTEYSPDPSYSGTSYGPFVRLANGTPIPGGVGNFSCSPSANMYVPPGNWFVDCSISAGANGVSIVFGGGHLVVNGGINISRQGACFAFNTPIAVPLPCPTVVNVGTATATTSTVPLRDGLIFVRGSAGITTGSNNTSILMPQTFVYQRPGGAFNVGGGEGIILWTAPGAGAPIAGTLRLDLQCIVAGVVQKACKDSRFSKLLYWNESTSGGSSIKGQAGFNLVGVFFDPRQDFEIAGLGRGEVDASAQFWINSLNNSGQGALNMRPDPALSVPRPFYSFHLIR